MTVVQTVGATGPALPDTLYQQQPDGTVGRLNLTGATIRFRLMPRFGGALVIDAPAVIVGAATDGAVRYDWTLTDSLLSGGYVGWWHILLADGVTTIDSPDFDVQWLAHGTQEFYGPAMDWCTTADIRACCADVIAGACLSGASRMASEFLYEMSGHRFLGQSQATVRPCRQGRCGFFGGPQILSQGHIVWGRNGWRDQMGQTCGCTPLPDVQLAGYPVISVDQVKIDGVVLDPAAYRLDDHRQLVRVDGGWWPICQNLAAPDSAAGSWSVTYTFGALPPLLGQRAAAQLGCEFYKACAGIDCRLPSGVTQLVRQGVTVTRVANAFAGGGVGLELVDAFLGAYGQGRPAVIWSPDVQYPRRV